MTAPRPAPRPGSIGAWRQALRIPSLSATISPILIGSSYALLSGAVDSGLVLLILAAAIACQAGANLANDYYDYRRGVDTVERPGSSKVIQQELLSPHDVRLGMVAAFTWATLLGLAIVALTGWTVFVLALACLAVAVLYNAGPKPLGYVALGEAAVFLAIGLAVVLGTVFVLSGSVTAGAVLIALPNACLVTAILHVNNMRDVDRDRAAGKRTLAMLLGRDHANRFYVALVAAAYFFVLVIVATTPILWPILAVAATLPHAIKLIRMVLHADDEAGFSRGLRGGNRLLLEFGLLMSAGLVIVAILGR